MLLDMEEYTQNITTEKILTFLEKKGKKLSEDDAVFLRDFLYNLAIIFCKQFPEL